MEEEFSALIKYISLQLHGHELNRNWRAFLIKQQKLAANFFFNYLLKEPNFAITLLNGQLQEATEKDRQRTVVRNVTHGQGDKAKEGNGIPYLLIIVSGTTQFLEGDKMPNFPNNINDQLLVRQIGDDSTNQQMKTSTELLKAKSQGAF